LKKTVLRYGLYGSITICALFLLSWFLGTIFDYSTQEIIGYVSMVVALTFVYFGIKHYRDIENQGVVTFKKGLVIGVLISLVTAFAFGVLDVIYVELLNPDFMAKYYADSAEQLRASLPANELEAKLAELEAEKKLFSNPLLSFLMMAVMVFGIGFIISLISALLLKRK